LDKIIFTGGSGVLGTEIQKINKNNNIVFPTSKQFDILSIEQCDTFITNNKPNIIIHAAAATNVKEIETSYTCALDVNVIGTINIIKLCQKYGLKLVYISTDYVFDGNKGNYTIDDPINPLSKYAKSKAAAELAVRIYDNHLVVRTSFFANQFPYDKAFIDQWTTKDYIDVMAPKILEACLSNEFGIKHVFSIKETIYEKAKRRKNNVLPISRNNIEGLRIPKDTSLI
jgi:dTDP-4-dehydrorhamnose reductase